MSDLQDDIYDVAIVGAGPAGSSAAIRLAGAGLKVILIEQKQFPRHKLCGEFISPECLEHFEKLGVLDAMAADGVPISRTVFYATHTRSVAVPNEWFKPGSHALGLSRSVMDDLLLERAKNAGVDIRPGSTAVGLRHRGEIVSGLELKNKELGQHGVNAKLTIDASGRSRVLSRHIANAAEQPGRTRAPYVAFKTHLTDAAVLSGDCEIYVYPGGYGGCSQVDRGLYNLCFIVAAETARKYRGDAFEIMKEVVFKNAQARRSLRDSRPIDDWLAVPIESYGRSPLAPANGLLTIGDAAAFIDPFTGSGILMALESSRIAADAITRGLDGLFTDECYEQISEDYKRQHNAAFDQRLRLCSRLRRAAFVPRLAEVMIMGLSLSQGVTKRLARATRTIGGGAAII